MAYQDLDSIHVPSAGQRPPAAWGTQVNANFDEIYTQLLAKLGAWTSYTPTLTQSATIGKTVTYARYVKLGRLVIAQGVLVATSSGSSNNIIQIGIPVPAVQTLIPVGQLWWVASGVYYPVAAALGTSTTFVGLIPATSLNLGQTFAGYDNQVASGDTLAYSVVYESAS